MNRPQAGRDYPAYLPTFETYEQMSSFATDREAVERLTPEEQTNLYRWGLSADNLTHAIVNDIITLYSRAVGDENQEEIKKRINSAGFYYYCDAPGVEGEEVTVYDSSELVSVDDDELSNEWRLGSKAWHSTKLRFQVLRDCGDQTKQYVNFYIDPNGINYRGWPKREKDMILDFADMLQGYLGWKGLLVDLQEVKTND